MNEQKSGKIVKIPAFRGKSPRKVRQVSPIRRQLVASHAVICGNFPDFSTTSLPEKSMYRDFSGRAVRKKRISTAIAAPTALRPEATCPTCHSGICHGFLSHRRGLFRGSVIFRGHENGGVHPRLWRLYGVISRYTYTVQWPIISISAASYGCKGVCNITDFLHHTYGRRLSLASTLMSV